MENNLKKHLVEFAEIAPKWLALLLGLMYGSGFLCVFTFLNHFGIYETGEEFFRVKYIHVGILFLLFPISILLPFLLSLSIKRIVPQMDKKKSDISMEKQPLLEIHSATHKEPHCHHNWDSRIKISSILIFMNMCGVFYLYILFTPRDFALSRAYVFPLIFVVSFLGPLLTDSFVKKNIVPHRSELFARILRWCLVLVIIGGLDYLAFAGFFKGLWRIFWGETWIPTGAIYYIIFIILIPYTIWRTNHRCKAIDHPRAKTEMRLSAACLCGMFYLLSILTFALTVYPRIPVAKGGGNFVENSCVKIDFRPLPGVSPIVDAFTPLERELSSSNNFVIIEVTPTYLFLARTNDAGGPIAWQKMVKIPNIVEIRQDSIDEIIYTQAPRID